MELINTIIVDLDGTLLNSKSEINLRTKETLIKAQMKGFRIILASGRPTSSMEPFALELQMDEYDGLMISYNGACIVDCKTRKVLFAKTLSVDLSKSTLKHLESFNTTVMITYKGYMFVEDVFADNIDLEDYFNGEMESINVIYHESRGGDFLLKEVANLADFINFPLFKLLVAADPLYLQENYGKITKPFENEISAVFSAHFIMKLLQKMSTKEPQ